MTSRKPSSAKERAAAKIKNTSPQELFNNLWRALTPCQNQDVSGEAYIVYNPIQDKLLFPFRFSGAAMLPEDGSLLLYSFWMEYMGCQIGDPDIWDKAVFKGKGKPLNKEFIELCRMYYLLRFVTVEIDNILKKLGEEKQ